MGAAAAGDVRCPAAVGQGARFQRQSHPHVVYAASCLPQAPHGQHAACSPAKGGPAPLPPPLADGLIVIHAP